MQCSLVFAGLEAFDTCSLSGNAVSAVQSFYPHVTNFNDSCEIQTGIFKLGEFVIVFTVYVFILFLLYSLGKC